MKYYCNPININYKYQFVSSPLDGVEKAIVFREAAGYNILWGYAPDKLYHSYMVFGKTSQRIGALIKGESVFVRVDTFNENGITEGKTYPPAS